MLICNANLYLISLKDERLNMYKNTGHVKKISSAIMKR